MALIFLYRSFLSPFFYFLRPIFIPNCKFYPTCSVYAREAVEKHGPFKGLLLGLMRLLRCNPLSKGGINLS